MLRLIEEDADSFAQRAEMYYQRRPELVNLIEEFYRAYRSLAERYDHLTGEIRQNIPRALQVQYGLSCDSPKSMGSTGVRLHSPLRKNHQASESWLKQVGQPADKVEESKHIDQMQTPSPLRTPVACLNQNCHDDHLLELQNIKKVVSFQGNLTPSSSDSDVDNLNHLEKLQQEIEFLGKENKMLSESYEKVAQRNITLQKDVEALEYQCKMQNEAHGLGSKMTELCESISHLQGERTTLMQVTNFTSTDMTDKEKIEDEKFFDKDIVPCGGEDRVATNVDVVNAHGFSDEMPNHSRVFECKHQDGVDILCSMQHPRSDSLQDQVAGLMQENQRQKLVILESGEEKREAIRQLCFSVDILKLENQRLEMMLGSMRKKFDATVNLHDCFAAWKRVLCLGD